MRFLETYFLIVGVLAWNSHQANVKECYKEGLFCESCKSLVHCTKTADGNWTKSSRQSCDFKKCLNGTCTDEPEPICDGIADITFECKNVGIFPHPFYCDKFVLCVDDWGLRQFVNDCGDGYGYDVATKNCDKKLEGNQCKERQYPVPLCRNLLESGPLDGDATIYYTCEQVNISLLEKVLYPVLRKCPHGQVYDATKLCH